MASFSSMMGMSWGGDFGEGDEEGGKGVKDVMERTR